MMTILRWIAGGVAVLTGFQAVETGTGYYVVVLFELTCSSRPVSSSCVRELDYHTQW